MCLHDLRAGAAKSELRVTQTVTGEAAAATSGSRELTLQLERQQGAAGAAVSAEQVRQMVQEQVETQLKEARQPPKPRRKRNSNN